MVLKPVLRVQATLDIHWGKHHRTYVTNLNGQVEGTDMESKSLEEVRTRCTVPILIRAAVHAGVDALAEECCGLLFAGDAADLEQRQPEASVQQRGAGVEPRVLLGVHEPQARGCVRACRQHFSLPEWRQNGILSLHPAFELPIVARLITLRLSMFY